MFIWVIYVFKNFYIFSCVLIYLLINYLFYYIFYYSVCTLLPFRIFIFVDISIKDVSIVLIDLISYF